MTDSGPVLIVAAHPDDEVLGCGGTMARHADDGATVHVLILAEGATSRVNTRDTASHRTEIDALREAAAKAAAILGAEAPRFSGLPDNRLDGIDLLDVIKRVEEVVAEVRPETVYTHHGGDLNIDHRIAHQAVVTACRPLPGSPAHNLYTFETVSSTEWAGPDIGHPFRPTRFVNITTFLDLKLEALACYEAELRPFPHPRSRENVADLAHMRGAGAGLHAAEAFMVVREIIS